MNGTAEKVLSALIALNKAKPKAIAKESGETPATVSYHLRGLLKSKKVVKKAGWYCPAGAAPEGAPETPKANGKGPRAKTSATPDLYTFAMTSDARLVILGVAPAPVILSEKQTATLATLMSNHFEGDSK